MWQFFLAEKGKVTYNKEEKKNQMTIVLGKEYR